jgi:hypothetical protein
MTRPTPHEKALEIVDRMCDVAGTTELVAKKSGLILVDEVIYVLQRNGGFTQCTMDLEYWGYVKLEMNILLLYEND